MLDVHSSFNLKRFIVAAIFGMFVLAASVFLGVNYAVDHAVSMDARTKAEDWSKYFINTMPDLNRLLIDGKLDDRQNNVVSTAAKVGNVFRFKLYDAKGKTILESDPETFERKADADHIDDDRLVPNVPLTYHSDFDFNYISDLGPLLISSPDFTIPTLCERQTVSIL